jgi:hypothetical protein
MGRRGVQFFFVVAFFLYVGPALRADPVIGRIYRLDFLDVDGNKLATGDGHITVVVLSRIADLDKARLVGERIPEYCVGNPAYRFVTVVSFQKKQSSPGRYIANIMGRRRLDTEAKRLQPRYVAKKLTRNPRRDVFAVLDFDGRVAASLGVEANSPTFQVFILDGRGELLQRWTNVPSSEQLAAVLARTVK